MKCKVDFISICENSARGEGNTQDLKCYRSGCENDLVTLKLRVLTRKTHFAQILIPALMMV